MPTKVMKIGLSNSDKATMKTQVHDEAVAQLITPYSTSSTYAVGDYCSYNGNIYKCTGATSGTWDSTKWSVTTLNGVIEDVNDAVDSVKNKANVNGNYPTMTVGLANNLDTKVVQNDVDAYNYRTSGGSLEIGDTCKEKAIVGGSLGFNQLVTHGNFDDGASWEVVRGTKSVSNNVCTYTITEVGNDFSANRISKAISISDRKIKNHKVFVTFTFNALHNSKGRFSLTDGNTIIYKNFDIVSGKHTYEGIIDIGNFEPTAIYAGFNGTDGGYEIGDSVEFSNVWYTSLTAIFGATIADYIYSLEQATAGAGVAWFKRYFPKSYYPYTPIGGFTHVKTSGKKVVGFNLFNKEVELVSGYISGYSFNITDGVKGAWLKCLPNTTYHFKKDFGSRFLAGSSSEILTTSGQKFNTVSTNSLSAKSFTFTTGPNDHYLYVWFYNANIDTGLTSQQIADTLVVNFHYDGERDGEYESYEEITYSVDDIELPGIPKLDAQGNLYFEGNRYNSDGTVDETHYKYVFTGNENWNYYEDGENSFWYLNDAGFPLPVRASDTHTSNAIVMIYQSSFRVYLRYNQNITSETNMNTIFPAGVEMVYPKATPTQSTATSFQESQQVDNWGTEEFLPPENDDRPCEVPVGHYTDYLLDIKSKAEIAPGLPSDDGTYVCKVDSGTAEYIPLGTWLTNNNYQQMQDLSDEITDVAGLTYATKKAYKIGNIVTITIQGSNSTGSTISSTSNLIKLGSHITPTDGSHFALARITGSFTNVEVKAAGAGGYIVCENDIINGGTFKFDITYAVA